MSFLLTQERYYPKINEVPLKINDLNFKINELSAIRYVGQSNLSISLKDVNTSENTFVRNFNVDLGINNLTTKDITKPLNTVLGVFANKISNAGQIINDLRLYSSVLNETNYDSTITPYGYGKWKVLITGDYIYQKALCKYTMQASLNADRPNTRVYLHKVDVPDVTDRGTVTLTKKNQPFNVLFSTEETRKFHIVPDVNVLIKSFSGVEGTPEIMVYDITTKGFWVTLKYGTEYADGSITYAARGY